MIDTAFVQINLEFHEALQSGALSAAEHHLGLYLALEANYFTHRVTRTLKLIAEELEWECTSETVRLRLAELRRLGFVRYEVKVGQHRGYVIQVTSKLVHGAPE